MGMDEAAFRAAWDGELKADEPMEGSTCRHMAPTDGSGHPGVAFMFDEGRFVRYTTMPDSQLVAPGGGKPGMDRQQIEALYPGKVKAEPHVYVSGGHYLRVVDGTSVLVFETDEAGKVSGWRVGHEPQVDWVEGCS
ncbi:lectin [Luteimonas sp. e5]